ncbi:GNAT family N-acetyltransferase [Pectobacterium parvum]|uniref:GNAT family N-acetyltransferase n=1 Tax=Pectobacterium parvum TaxID=2778550 RepID=UPI000B1CB418|nr:GNAT family N-acetyltransferase [Pectobacterium parvum]
MHDMIIKNTEKNMININEVNVSFYMSDNISEKFSSLARQLPDMQVRYLNGLQYIDCGKRSDTFNTVFGTPTSQEDITHITQYYRQRNMPAAWWFAEPTTVIAELLEQAGWCHEENDVGMYFPLTAPIPACPKKVLSCIEYCDSPVRFRDFGQVLSAIFEPGNPVEAENIRAIYQAAGEHCTRLDEHLIQLVGYLDGVPVSTATLYLKDNVAGVFDIATPEKWRRQGFGSEMFHSALQLALKKQAKICVLQASPDGLNIYKKSGFKISGKFEVWNLSATA